MSKLRVLIVDDSALARALLREFLENEPYIEVVAEAANGRDAVEMARTLQPDLITMDLEMPLMNGMQAIEEIMCNKAVPILVVSSLADAQNACEAIGRGALEVVSKPEYHPQAAQAFVERVRLLARVPVITHIRSRRMAADPPPLSEASEPVGAAAILTPEQRRLFAIASSTGGPQALAQILPMLPAHFPGPILIAQHISDGFAAGMAEWLDSICQLKVQLATDGCLIEPGVAYISPSEWHLTVTPGRRIQLQPRDESAIYRPSCDHMLQSVAEIYRRQAVGIILTGMGSDGAKGLASIRENGGLTLAQDEASSVIYGMNRVAMERGVVEQLLPLTEIAPRMLALAQQANAA